MADPSAPVTSALVTPVRVALLSTSETDLLSARASGAAYTWANPSRATDADLTATVAGARVVVGA